MSFVNISAVYTADPGRIWTPKNSFKTGDPFAIVLNAQADSSLVSAGLLYDVEFQIVNPRQDPTTDTWWTYQNGNVLSVPTLDSTWNGVAFQWTNFAVWWWWPRYADAVSPVYGPSILGVYYVQGTINVEGSDLFANSGQFWFKAR